MVHSFTHLLLYRRNFPSSSPHDVQQIANSHHWSPACCIASFVPAADLLVGSIMSLQDINCMFVPVHAVLRFTHPASLTKMFALNIFVYFIPYSHHLEHWGSFAIASGFAPKPVSRLKQKQVIYILADFLPWLCWPCVFARMQAGADSNPVERWQKRRKSLKTQIKY